MLIKQQSICQSNNNLKYVQSESLIEKFDSQVQVSTSLISTAQVKNEQSFELLSLINSQQVENQMDKDSKICDLVLESLLINNTQLEEYYFDFERMDYNGSVTFRDFNQIFLHIKRLSERMSIGDINHSSKSASCASAKDLSALYPPPFGVHLKYNQDAATDTPTTKPHLDLAYNNHTDLNCKTTTSKQAKTFMKTKEAMGGVDVSIFDGPCLSGPSSSGHHGHTMSEHFNTVMDTMDLLNNDCLDVMSTGTITPTETESSTEPEVSTDIDVEEEDEVEDHLSDSDSEWEDIDDDDEEDDDDCVLFQEDATFGTNNFQDCFSRFQTSSSGVLETSQCHKYKATPTPRLILKINGFFSCNINKGSRTQNHLCWAAKLTQTCNKKRVILKKKQVRFNDDQLVQVMEFEDDDDTKQNRKVYWEIFAVDRARFKERIYRTEQSIGEIFEEKHRQKVYSERILPYLAKLDQSSTSTNLSDETSNVNQHNAPSSTSNCDPEKNPQNQQVRRPRHRSRRNKKSKSKS